MKHGRHCSTYLSDHSLFADRSCLSLSHLSYCIWSYSDLCSVTMFCWHSVLFMVSIAKFSEVKLRFTKIRILGNPFDAAGCVALLAPLSPLIRQMSVRGNVRASRYNKRRFCLVTKGLSVKCAHHAFIR